MRSFEYNTPTHVVFGKDSVEKVGALVAEQGCKKVLIHYGGGSAKRSGLLDRVSQSLDASGVAYVMLGGVVPNPRLSLVREGIDADYFGRILRANYGSTLKSLNSFESIAISLVEGCFEGYDPLLFPEMYDSITQEDLLTFMRENLCREHMALSVVYPKE